MNNNYNSLVQLSGNDEYKVDETKTIIKTKFSLIFRIVSTYLVHHGYCNTAEAFAKIIEQPISEDLTSIKNRQSTSTFKSL